MNYLLKVDSCNIDKVVLKLVELGSDIIIKNVLRSMGIIYVKTNFINNVKPISEIVEIKKESFLPQLLLF